MRPRPRSTFTTTTTTTMATVWCLLINHKNKPIGTLFELVPRGDIADLKEQVKETASNDLSGVSAHQLTVWRCVDRNVIFDDEDPTTLEGQVREAFAKVERLGPRRVIRELGFLTGETLLVKLPIPVDVTVWCLVINHENKPIGTPFKLVVGRNIAELKEKVKEKKSIDLPADELTVWQCKERKLFADKHNEELEELINTINFSDKANALTSATAVISLDLDENEILLVRMPEHGSKRKLDDVGEAEAMAENRDADGVSSTRAKYLRDQDANVKAAQRGLTPSRAAYVSNLEFQQSIAPVFNGRPFKYTGPPIGLYHPVFNEFQKALEGNDEVPLDIRLNVQRYIGLSAEVYNSEKERQEAIKSVCGKLFGGQLMSVSSHKAESDGVICVTAQSWNAYALILELKNEVGTGNSDPFLQASFAYQQYCAHDDYSDLRRRSYSPSFLVAIAGPWLCVGGAVHKQAPIAQPLTDLMHTGTQSSQTRLERVFYCLRAAVESLRQYYTVSLALTAPNEEVCGYPYIREYDGRAFSYVEELGAKGDDTQVFKVKEGDEFRVVKFATEYNEAAHKLLSTNESFAPALHHVSQVVYGGRRMIVMDYVEGEMALNRTLSDAHLEQLKRALGVLHNAGLVFGDLREQNIMIEGDRVRLVDFDWCGKDGETKYPIDLNTSSRISWADGVGPGLTMRKEHDEAMLMQLHRSAKDTSIN